MGKSILPAQMVRSSYRTAPPARRGFGTCSSVILGHPSTFFTHSSPQATGYPHLSPKYKESFDVGSNIFAKFSAYIKNPHKEANENFEKALLREFKRLDTYLNNPLPEEIDQDSTEEVLVSKRKFLDGNRLTLADCNLLPKLHIIKIAAKKYRNFEIPAEMTGIWRYLHNAYSRDEFSHTCPANEEIERTYASVAKKMT
ncbi:chloride intracellular channel protein 2 isoform X2 [Mauremys reevesii]|uniref:chloride intracellular channel protein 2 isoform X2 n=1 Tax=Mauremys reevesii TaxID=260615 RepID=UPI00193EC9F0|nr:chloride intracellular channel protein 2 isoform X2 [Mauremys reevesii]